MPQPTSGMAAWSPAYGCAGSIASAASSWRLRSVCAPSVRRTKAMPISQTSSSTPQSTYAPAEYGREHLRDDTDRAGRSAQPRKPRWKRPTGSGEIPAGCRGSAEPRSRPSLRAIRTSAPATKGVPAQPLWPRPRTCRSAEPSRAIHHPSCATRTTPPRMPRRVGWGVDGHMRRDRASVGRRCISGSRGAAWCSAVGRLRVPAPG
jgi:hypothetical protein